MDGIGELARMLGKGRSRGEGHARAKVTRVEADGTVYADVPGGAGEFPLTRVLAGARVGDWIEVEFRGGAAIAAGNATDPSAGASRVRTVELRTDAAVEAAARAAEAANTAEADARRAHDAADEAQESASTANTAANDALVQLATVEDVIGTVEWIAEHGTYEPTEDVAVDDSKVYFTRSGSGTQADPYVYTAVPEPTDEGLPGYYELHVDDALSQYVASHLALTDAGLYVLKDESGYKVLLSNDGMSVIDPQGHPVATYGASVDFASGRDWHMGGNDAYIFYDASEGTVTIGGSAVRLGDSRTLSELMAAVDGTIVFKVTEDYSADHSTATLTAHVYSGGEDVASQYAGSCFAWYRKDESGTSQDSTVPMVPLGNGRTITVARSTVGFGAAIVCRFTPPNDSVLLDGDDDTLTDSEGTPISGRTPSGDYVRVADLEATTTVFDADRLMLVGSEGESLVSIATLKDVFGDGDYERLSNKPSIEGVPLIDDKSFPDLGIFRTDAQGYSVADDYTLTTMDINALWANAQPIGG